MTDVDGLGLMESRESALEEVLQSMIQEEIARSDDMEIGDTSDTYNRAEGKRATW